MDLRVGCVVEVAGVKGTVKFLGKTEFAPGVWAGLELFEATGKNNGAVQGISYFTCEDKFGLFVRATTIKNVISNPDGSVVSNNSTENVAESKDATPLKSSPMKGSQSGIVRKASSPSGSPSPSRRSTGLPKRPSNPSTSSSMTGSAVIKSEENLLGETPPVAKEIAAPIKAEAVSNVSNSLISEEARRNSISVSSAALAAANRESEELRLKLKILEGKRAEDREKIRDLEKTRNELTEVQSAKEKLASKVQLLQQELRETQKQLKESTANQDDTEIHEKDLLDQLEHLTLDKEMAEEKAESLSLELDLLKEKVEELTLNLEILQNEHELVMSGTESTAAGTVNKDNVELLQLEKQNERLKEALIKLRDSTSLEDAEKTRKIKALEKDLSSLNESKALYEKTKEKLSIAEDQIEELKLSLDDALGAESMVEDLTNKILNLEDALHSLKEENEDLLALKEINDELEEQHQETEKQLMTENDALNSVLLEERLKNDYKENTIADYERTIVQFRGLVKILQSDILELREREKSQKDFTENLSSQSQAMMSLNLQLQNTVLKTQAKQLEMEMRKLDTAQAKNHLSIVVNYLSKSFSDCDKDAIEFFLGLERINFKSITTYNYFDDNYCQDENGFVSCSAATARPTALTRKQQMQILSLKFLLRKIVEISHEFHCNLMRSKPENFVKTGALLNDLAKCELKIDDVIELVMKDTILDVDVSLDLEEIINVISKMKQGYVDPSVDPSFVRNELFSFLASIDMAVGKAHQIIHDLSKGQETSVSSHQWHLDPQKENFVNCLAELITGNMRELKASMKKLERRFLALSETGKTIDESLMLEKVVEKSAKIFAFIEKIYQALFENSSSKDASSIAKISAALSESLFGLTEQSPLSGIFEFHDTLIKPILGSIFKSYFDDSIVLEVSNDVVKPWILRGKVICSEYELNRDLQKKLEGMLEERKALILQLQEKENYLQEIAVKNQHVDSKISGLKSQLEEIPVLKEQLAKSKEQERVYEEAMDSLHADIEKLEQRLSESSSGPKDSTPIVSVNTAAAAISSLMVSDDSNRNRGFVVHKLKEEIIRLKGILYSKSLDPLDELNEDWPVVKPSRKDDRAPIKSKISKFIKDVNHLSSSFKLVDLKAKKSLSSYHVQASILETLFKQSAGISDVMSLDDGGPKLGMIGSEKHIGRIRIAERNTDGGGRESVKLEFREFADLHSSLLS